jgi:hypothetical protein
MKKIKLFFLGICILLINPSFADKNNWPRNIEEFNTSYIKNIKVPPQQYKEYEYNLPCDDFKIFFTVLCQNTNKHEGYKNIQINGGLYGIFAITKAFFSGKKCFREWYFINKFLNDAYNYLPNIKISLPESPPINFKEIARKTVYSIDHTHIFTKDSLGFSAEDDKFFDFHIAKNTLEKTKNPLDIIYSPQKPWGVKLSFSEYFYNKIMKKYKLIEDYADSFYKSFGEEYQTFVHELTHTYQYINNPVKNYQKEYEKLTEKYGNTENASEKIIEQLILPANIAHLRKRIIYEAEAQAVDRVLTYYFKSNKRIVNTYVEEEIKKRFEIFLGNENSKLQFNHIEEDIGYNAQTVPIYNLIEMKKINSKEIYVFKKDLPDIIHKMEQDYKKYLKNNGKIKEDYPYLELIAQAYKTELNKIQDRYYESD